MFAGVAQPGIDDPVLDDTCWRRSRVPEQRVAGGYVNDSDPRSVCNWVTAITGGRRRSVVLQIDCRDIAAGFTAAEPALRERREFRRALQNYDIDVRVTRVLYFNLLGC